MRIYISIILSVVVGTLFSLLVKNLIKRINRKIWKFSKIDTLAFYLPFSALFFALIWITGKIFIVPFFMSIGAVGIIEGDVSS